MASPLRIGIVGAGRTRNGLGPYLARHFEAAGDRVVGVSGRDLASGGRAGAALTRQLGHPIEVHRSARELAATVDLLVVASPAEVHLEGLQAALAAGVACLCEKPLVLPEHTDAGIAMVEAFAARGLPLVENCQWPFVLPTLFELHPELRGAPVESVSMGLCPAASGRAMILDSLSHVLSIVQAVVDVDPAGGALGVAETDPGPAAEHDILSFELPVALSPQPAGQPSRVAVTLTLERRDTQPRPAWIELNGRRVDRRIGEGYAQFLVAADGREKPMPDPLAALVYGLRQFLTPSARDDTRTPRQSIVTRLRSFRSILDALDAAEARRRQR